MILREVTSTADPVWPSFEALLFRSFPPEEIEAPESVRSQLDEGWGHRCLVWEGSPGEAWALVRALVLPEARCGWIVHIALEPHLRGAGRGPEMFRQTAEFLKEQEPRLRGIILEVERLEDAQDEEERRAREKRLAFFSRLGVSLLTAEYVQPPAWPGGPPVPLNLFWLPVTEEKPDSEEIVRAFYKEGLGQPEDSPYLAQALSSLKRA